MYWSKSHKHNLSKAHTCLKRTKILAPKVSALDRFYCISNCQIWKCLLSIIIRYHIQITITKILRCDWHIFIMSFTTFYVIGRQRRTARLRATWMGEGWKLFFGWLGVIKLLKRENLMKKGELPLSLALNPHFELWVVASGNICNFPLVTAILFHPFWLLILILSITRTWVPAMSMFRFSVFSFWIETRQA